MSVRNQDWYNLNESIPYPLQDSASAISDGGQRLPSHVLVDLNLRFPSTLGRYAFLGACTVSPHLVTLVILGSQSPASPVSVVPLAAVSLVKPVSQYRPLTLSPLAAGVGGWIVLGGGVEEQFAGRFSSPAQSLLSPRAARMYSPLPVESLGKYNQATALTGLIRLVGGNDVEIVKECREIPGVTPSSVACDEGGQEVIVIRLRETVQGSQRNVYDLYRGPCGKRPESGTCGDPQPIEFLGPVVPDCCGNITLELAGCAEITGLVQEAVLDEEGEVVQVDEACGVVVRCGLSLDDMCEELGALPDDQGRLPGEDDEDFCSVYTLVLPEEEAEGAEEPYEETPGCGSLATWDATFLEPDWTDKAGHMYETGGEMRCDDAGIAGALPCLRLYDVDLGTACRQGQLTFTVRSGLYGHAYSAGMVFGWQWVSDTPYFYTAVLSWDGRSSGKKVLQVRYWCGFAGQNVLLQEVETPDVALNEEYTLTVTIGTPTATGAPVAASITGDGVFYVTETMNRFVLQTGRWGLWADHSRATFTAMQVAEN